MADDPMLALRGASSIGEDVPSRQQVQLGMMPMPPNTVATVVGNQWGPDSIARTMVNSATDAFKGLAARYGYDQYTKRFGKPQVVSKLEQLLTNRFLGK